MRKLKMEILKDLFDEKIIKIINLFLENPDKRYSLTDISNLAKVNVATTSRILNKLIEKRFIKSVVIGRIKIYRLEKNEKTLSLMKLLKKEPSPLQRFIENITSHPRIKKIILDSRENNAARILIVGDFLPTSKIERKCEEIKERYNFKIEFVEISENQYEKLKNFNYDLKNKIIWERKNLQNN